MPGRIAWRSWASTRKFGLTVHRKDRGTLKKEAGVQGARYAQRGLQPLARCGWPRASGALMSSDALKPSCAGMGENVLA
eukprot:3282051-Pleurochrysis_carterae.AAC.2